MLIDGVIDRMQATLGPLQAAGDPRQYFHATYLRTTIAARDELRRDGFADPGWVERWDVAFAGFYLDALQAALAGQGPAGGHRRRGRSPSPRRRTCPPCGTSCSA